MGAPRVIALLTDFGTRDWYVAAMKAIILSRCPSASLVDITHEVPAQDIVSGAFVLAAAVPWFPRGAVIVGVVDPGVGSARALVAAEADGRFLLGPDNGLLAPSCERAGRLRMVRLTPSKEWLRPVSRTFQGRDVLAPVAAAIARGVSLARLGRTITALTPLEVPKPVRRGKSWQGRIVHIDGFGNLLTNLPAPPAGAWPLLRYRHRAVPLVSSYYEGRTAELVGVVGSLGFVELAMRNGSAAAKLRARRGEPVELSISSRSAPRGRRSTS